MSNRSKYKEFIKNKTVSIFNEDWWLDITASDNWDAVLVEDKEREVISLAMPICKKSFLGMARLRMPVLSPRLEIIRASQYSNDQIYRDSTSEDEYKLFNQLREYNIRINLGLDDILVKYPQDHFRVTTRYTFQINRQNTPFDNPTANWSYNERQSCQQAEKILMLSSTGKLEVLYDILEKSDRNTFDFELWASLDKVLSERKRRKIITAVDSKRNIHAFNYLVWDRTTVISLITGRNLRAHPGAVPLAHRAGIDFALRQNLSYDFEGSMYKSVATFFSRLGGSPVAYPELSSIGLPFNK